VGTPSNQALTQAGLIRTELVRNRNAPDAYFRALVFSCSVQPRHKKAGTCLARCCSVKLVGVGYLVLVDHVSVGWCGQLNRRSRRCFHDNGQSAFLAPGRVLRRLPRAFAARSCRADGAALSRPRRLAGGAWRRYRMCRNRCLHRGSSGTAGRAASSGRAGSAMTACTRTLPIFPLCADCCRITCSPSTLRRSPICPVSGSPTTVSSGATTEVCSGWAALRPLSESPRARALSGSRSSGRDLRESQNGRSSYTLPGPRGSGDRCSGAEPSQQASETDLSGTGRAAGGADRRASAQPWDASRPRGSAYRLRARAHHPR